MWTSVDELRQIGKLETVSKIIQILSSKYFARPRKRSRKHSRKTFVNLEPDQDVSNSFAKIL